GYVGSAERRARDVDVLERVSLHPGCVLDCDDALIRGLVCERRSGYQITDRVDAVGGGVHRAVDLDQTAVLELHACGLEPEAFEVGPGAGGDPEPVDLALTGAKGELDARFAGLDLLDGSAGVDRHALLLEPSPRHLGDVGILGR